MLDNKWDSTNDAVQYSFLSRLVVKKKTVKGYALDFDVQMLDVVSIKIDPEMMFIVYYITVRLKDRTFE